MLFFIRKEITFWSHSSIVIQLTDVPGTPISWIINLIFRFCMCGKSLCSYGDMYCSKYERKHCVNIDVWCFADDGPVFFVPVSQFMNSECINGIFLFIKSSIVQFFSFILSSNIPNVCKYFFDCWTIAPQLSFVGSLRSYLYCLKIQQEDFSPA